ncbi:MAG: PKD domain-containing protein [Holophagales bacterium]|nr:PKD domain-containing protein [Holophagales bacterium]
MDGSGNVYVADQRNHTVRKVTVSGVVTTLAGVAGSWGNVDGTGSAGRFFHPSGVAMDGLGTVYVADTHNHSIRKGTAALPDTATIDSPTGPTGSTRHLGSSPRTASSWLWEVVRRPVDSTAPLSAANVAAPTFAPDRSGLYTFRLTASDGGQSSISMVDLTATAAAPSASFSWSPANPVSGQTVQFTDTSVGSPTSWVWSFAAGASSTLRNPTHVFAIPGTYPVSLLATNENGSSTVGRLVTVTQGGGTRIDFTVSDASSGLLLSSLGDGYEARAGQLLKFSATGAIGSVSWDFGDGTSSLETNPVKSFAPVDDTSYVVSVSSGGESRQRPLLVKAPSVPPDPLLWVAAGMAWVDGFNGERWQSDLSIYNPATQPATYSLAFVSGAGWEGATNAVWPTLEVGSGETRAFRNILADHFGLARGAWGVVLVRGDSAPLSPVIVSRTYNAADAEEKGTFGLSVPAMWVGSGVGPQSNAAASFLADLRHDASYRTNLTVANLKDETAEVEVLFRDASGIVLGSPAKVTIEARGVKQVNAALSAAPATGAALIGGAGHANPVSHFSAEVKLNRGTGVYPYATVIDQGTGDSIVVTPPARPSTIYRLPGIVRVKGKTGSWWKSDVAVLNPGSSPRKILATYSYVKAGASSRVEVSNVIALQPHELSVAVDFVRHWLSLAEDDPDGYASSWVDFAPAPDDPAPSEPIVVTGKTYSPSGAGSAGLQVDAFVLEDGLSRQGSRSALVLSGMQANTRYRTNVALFLTPGSTGSVQVDVHVLDALGHESKTFEGVAVDASNPFVQLASADLFANLTTDPSSRATIVIDAPRGTGSVAAYATVIDNLSEDAVFVARQPAP